MLRAIDVSSLLSDFFGVTIITDIVVTVTAVVVAVTYVHEV